MDVVHAQRHAKGRRRQRRRGKGQCGTDRSGVPCRSPVAGGNGDDTGSGADSLRLLDLPDECLVEIVRFVGISGGVAALDALRATSTRLARVGRDAHVWREIFAREAGAPPGTRQDRLRPPAWSNEPWSVSARRIARPLEILSGTVSLSVRSVWTDAFDPAEGVAVWTMRHDTRTSGDNQTVMCRDGPSAAVHRVIDDYAAHRTQCHVWLAAPVDSRDGHDAPRARTLWRPLRVVHAFNAAEPVSIPWDWWWALVPPDAPPDSVPTARFIVVDLWWIDPADRSSTVPACVTAAHAQGSPSWDGSRGAHPWYTPEFALRHVVGCDCP
ncbi:hypothetical protein TW95_gp1676 [Pandoravirus inopinatum]|uniref:F-box domain protein n=1 Tax=Pandoravirus inopinatum TaxID=1605721 RepID=A0A0B5J8X3_9VIRU|nr:hypothetical protein TW95_gp1676 [Pandoravirus inopinatum]AJF98410.1 hypothetical protein [Pandoravirus inopinatum]